MITIEIGRGAWRWADAVALAVCLSLCLGLGAGALSAQEAATGDVTASGSRILADRIEQNGNIISAWGRVRVFYRDLILLADHVELNSETRDTLAEGQVSLRLPNELITAGQMTVNLDTALGRMSDAFGLMEPTVLFSSETMDREREDFYRLGRSKFTACTQAVPRWSVTCAKANLRKNDYVEVWGATFSVKKIPVFYLPYAKYPLAQSRASGFLIPQIGYSGVKGFSVSESYYWAIARNMDATFNVDYYGAKGMGGGIEYRYLFGSPDKAGAQGLYGGEARVYYFRFRALEDGTTPDPAYLVRWNHNQVLPGGFTLTAAVNYQSSFNFLREFDNNFKRAIIFNQSSQVYLTRTWGGLTFSARAMNNETSFQSINNSIVSRSLPQINLNLARVKILGQLGFTMSASYSDWQYGWKSQFESGTPLKNKTINVFPTLSLPWASIPWLTMNFSLTGNVNYSFTSKDSVTNAIVDVPYLAANYGFEVSAIGPSFYKIYDFGKPAPGETARPRLKHVIEPYATYHYEPPWAHPERIVSMRAYRQDHSITYGLTNRFFYKSTGAATEVLTIGISQSYYLTPYESVANQYLIMDWLPAGVSLRYSDINAYVRFFAGSKLSLDYASSYNTYKDKFAANRLSVNYGLPQDDYFFRLSWYLSRYVWYDDAAFWDRHQLSAGGGIRLPSLNLDAMAEIDYNIQENKLLFLSGSVVYHYQCIDLRLEGRMFYYRDEPEFQIRFSFDLAGVGKSSDFLGGSRYD